MTLYIAGQSIPHPFYVAFEDVHFHRGWIQIQSTYVRLSQLEQFFWVSIAGGSGCLVSYRVPDDGIGLSFGPLSEYDSIIIINLRNSNEEDRQRLIHQLLGESQSMADALLKLPEPSETQLKF